MASKDEYFMRIIASLQSEITALKTGQSEAIKEIKDLKSTIGRLQKEIEALKASPSSQQSLLNERLTGADKAHLLKQARSECEAMIQFGFEMLSSRFADKRDFDSFRNTVAKTYLPIDTFTSYHKSQDVRLKSIEEKLSCPFSLQTIFRSNQEPKSSGKTSFNFDTIIRIIKSLNLKWLVSIIVFFSLCLLASYLINSMTE